MTLPSTVTLPEWVPAAGVDSTLIIDWPRYREVLAIYEQGHRELADKGAGRLRRALESVPMKSCASIATSTKTVGETLMKDLRLEQAAYDRDTRHGTTQGATTAKPAEAVATRFFSLVAGERRADARRLLDIAPNKQFRRELLE